MSTIQNDCQFNCFFNLKCEGHLCIRYNFDSTVVLVGYSFHGLVFKRVRLSGRQPKLWPRCPFTVRNSLHLHCEHNLLLYGAEQPAVDVISKLNILLMGQLFVHGLSSLCGLHCHDEYYHFHYEHRVADE